MKQSLVNRTMRAKLPVMRDPYWHLIAAGQYLGYRKTGETRGTWIARFYVREGENKAYRFQSLGEADDTVQANSTHVLSFAQAVEKAQKWFKERSRAAAAGVSIGPYTVSDAADAWIASWKGSDASRRNSESNLKHHILPVLGSIEVAKLTRHQVQEWLHYVASKPPVRGQLHEEIKAKLSPSRRSKTVYDPNDPETKRKRQDTANRVFNDLRALLSLAYDNQYVVSKAAWETVRRFENVDVAKNEYLTIEEAVRFIEHCPPDFRDLVRGALVTGCRYAELAGLKVSAYDVQLRAVSLIQPKTGKRKHVFLTDEEEKFFAELTRGKRSGDFIFLREDGQPWERSNQQPRMKLVLKAAGINRHIRFHDLRHTFASWLAMNGTSIQLIANQLGHSGTRMAEKHYAHFSPEYLAATIRANKPSFGILAK